MFLAIYTSSWCLSDKYFPCSTCSSILINHCCVVV